MAAARETPGNGSISLSTPGSHWHTARKPIEDQLLYYYERIHELNGQLNALCPIHAFPPEVLSKVLLYLAGHYAESPPRLQDWIQVTHVCRYWRAVALGCSTLWARFTITTPRDPEWMAVFLERSKQLPLSVSVSPRHKPYKWISGKSLEEPLSLVLSYLSRIRTLYLTLETMCSPEVLELLDGPAPLLEYLAITEHQSIPRRRATAVSDPLSRLLRRPETARLRHLELQCPVDWTGLSLQGLTRLHVKTPVIATSLSAFLGALAQMPVLEELVTGRAFARGPQAGEEADTSPLPTQAALRTLRTVRIEESAAITICILCSLDTPSLSHVSVDSSSFNSDPTGSYVELVGATAKKVGTLGQLTTLVIGTNLSGQDATGTYVSAYCDVLESQSMDPAEDSTQTWVSEHSPALELYCGPSTITTPFAVLCDLLPMGDVRCIILRGTLPSHELWTNLVRYAPFATGVTRIGRPDHLYTSPTAHPSQRDRRRLAHRSRRARQPLLRTSQSPSPDPGWSILCGSLIRQPSETYEGHD
ncbi:uncharacterized protein C8Q71DRAFT_351665 [Rhodofomes roseus]|uniref:F-box domain-containing protein n=1 Tax=Rhodofomes roseus TaxID=34475 RepID=A0ABQ8KTW0_9APHY|nr:uncharacterized protein C8Q71DRAFT_351665 [Rhodofomes roseus]KAH9841861.1 hypothetical protein C8Q71DRAFT_351665 [Rhodofomes roseus]